MRVWEQGQLTKTWKEQRNGAAAVTALFKHMQPHGHHHGSSDFGTQKGNQNQRQGWATNGDGGFAIAARPSSSLGQRCGTAARGWHGFSLSLLAFASFSLLCCWRRWRLLAVGWTQLGDNVTGMNGEPKARSGGAAPPSPLLHSLSQLHSQISLFSFLLFISIAVW